MKKAAWIGTAKIRDVYPAALRESLESELECV